MTSRPESPYAELATERGRALIAGLEAFTEARLTDAVAYARARVPAPLAAAALATVFARRRAVGAHKFERPHELIFTREGFEQATAEAVARHRAERFAGLHNVADLCCGVGGDTLALARAGCDVLAIDLDADARACVQANAAALGFGERVRVVSGDAATVDLSGCDAAFADPSRRSSGQRAKSGEDYSPPLAAVLARALDLPGHRLAVKAAPGLRVHDRGSLGLAQGIALEVELVSDRGTCKESVLWCGELARCDGARRATVIRSGQAAVLDGTLNSDAPPSSEFRTFIGEPDGAVIRAGLIGELCAIEHASVLDRKVAYLTADAPARTAFARWFRLIEALPFNVHRVRARLRELALQNVIVKTRAFPMLPDEIRALLRVGDGGDAVVICATLREKKWALVCGTAEP
ncbi:MAG TPA: methyltransferase domain-containing protein [Candidatus Eremiobacteraceae bacterium]|nr:methyltransferase domain-containing protein [Candidatus Eremiobacteraceae bacterium]